MQEHISKMELDERLSYVHHWNYLVERWDKYNKLDIIKGTKGHK